MSKYSRHQPHLANQFGTWMYVSYKRVKLNSPGKTLNELLLSFEQLKQEQGDKKLIIDRDWDIGLYVIIPQRRPATQEEIDKYLAKKEQEKIQEQKYKERRAKKREENEAYRLIQKQRYEKQLRRDIESIKKEMHRTDKLKHKFATQLERNEATLARMTNSTETENV